LQWRVVAVDDVAFIHTGQPRQQLQHGACGAARLRARAARLLGAHMERTRSRMLMASQVLACEPNPDAIAPFVKVFQSLIRFGATRSGRAAEPTLQHSGSRWKQPRRGAC
jgi:hypothetical protein